jgi:two-component system OmpR family sensor kinase
MRTLEAGGSAAGTLALPELDDSPEFIVLYGSTGRLLASSQAARHELGGVPAAALGAAAAGRTQFIALETEAAPLRAVVLPISQGRVLLYAASRSAVDEDTMFLLRMLPVVFAIAVALTAFAAHWLGGLLARDVLTIGDVARAVAGGDLAARVGARVRGSRESHQLGNDLDEMVERLGMLLEAQRRFAIDAAHELRSPIATIRGEIQLALRRERSAEAYRQVLEELHGDVEALAHLSEDLLALSRSEGAAAPRDEASAREIVDDALWMARGLAGERGATLQVVESTPGASAAKVRGARGELARVVRNLLDNAIRYGTKGDPAVRVELSADGEHVEVAVVDHGPGVSPSERDAIFAAFHRGVEGLAAPRDGAGLGLFIAREIARAHRGDVVIDAGVAEGARFVLQLERTPAAA